MAGGRPTYPFRPTSAPEEKAGAERRTVLMAKARKLLAVLSGFCGMAMLPASWLPSIAANPQNSQISAGQPAPVQERMLSGSDLGSPATVLHVGISFRQPPETALFEALYAEASELNRITVAVEVAESSRGADPLMWRLDLGGPQGPMQVSEAAAADVGGGNRWDPGENRALGRAYLAKMYQRFGNWTDAVMAYNWGPGSLGLWIREGRPADKLIPTVGAYRDRVRRNTGLEAAGTARGESAPLVMPQPPQDRRRH